MGIVGNAEDARFIYEWAKARRLEGFDYWYRVSREGCKVGSSNHRPDGWEFLGAGMYRIAMLSPDGVCYKVERDPMGKYGQTNFEEFENYLRLVTRIQMPEGARLPDYTFYEVSRTERMYRTDVYGVSAMECVSGTTLTDQKDSLSNDDHQMISQISRACGLTDIHGGNVMKDKDGQYVLVDIGA